jgi:hypothetical protein
MGDLICRQAAIDALDEIEAEVADGYGYQYAKWREYFAEMPSAQPEEDCDTCKHGYFGDTCCNNCKVRFPSHYERRTDE